MVSVDGIFCFSSKWPQNWNNVVQEMLNLRSQGITHNEITKVEQTRLQHLDFSVDPLSLSALYLHTSCFQAGSPDHRAAVETKHVSFHERQSSFEMAHFSLQNFCRFWKCDNSWNLCEPWRLSSASSDGISIAAIQQDKHPPSSTPRIVCNTKTCAREDPHLIL